MKYQLIATPRKTPIGFKLMQMWRKELCYLWQNSFGRTINPKKLKYMHASKICINQDKLTYFVTKMEQLVTESVLAPYK